jgi:hypothetical protein
VRRLQALATCTEEACREPKVITMNILIAAALVGSWCTVEIDGTWTWFERGKCKDDQHATLILKKNGDYTITGLGDDLVCKAVPKTRDNKGWTDYNCTHYGARVIKQPKSNQKFVTADGRLGLNR